MLPQRDSTDILRDLYEYQKLVGRRALLGQKADVPFGDVFPDGDMSLALERLDLLEQQFAPASDEPSHGAHRLHGRREVRLWATLKAAGRAHSVRVVNVGGGGMCVQPAPSLRQGERAVLRIPAASDGTDYAFPVLAQWIFRGKGFSAMGLPFVGAPLQISGKR